MFNTSIAADCVKQIWNYATAVLHFHKGILLPHWLNFPLKNFSMFRRIQFIAQEKKTGISILNVDKKFIQFQ